MKYASANLKRGSEHIGQPLRNNYPIFVPVPNLGLQRVSNYQACSTNKASVKTEAFVYPNPLKGASLMNISST